MLTGSLIACGQLQVDDRVITTYKESNANKVYDFLHGYLHALSDIKGQLVERSKQASTQPNRWEFYVNGRYYAIEIEQTDSN